MQFFCMASLSIQITTNNKTLSTVSKALCLTSAGPIGWAHSVCLHVALRNNGQAIERSSRFPSGSTHAAGSAARYPLRE